MRGSQNVSDLVKDQRDEPSHSNCKWKSGGGDNLATRAVKLPGERDAQDSEQQDKHVDADRNTEPCPNRKAPVCLIAHCRSPTLVLPGDLLGEAAVHMLSQPKLRLSESADSKNIVSSSATGINLGGGYPQDPFIPPRWSRNRQALQLAIGRLRPL